MSGTILRAAVAALFLGNAAAAAAAEPLDFDYVIDGPSPERPTLVFNDGRDTWIQPRQGGEIQVLDMPFERRGPYLVVRGLPYRIALRSGGETLTVARLNAPPAPAFFSSALAPAAVRCEERRVAVPFPRLRAAPDQRTQEALNEAARASRQARLVVVIGHPDTRSERLARARAERVKEGLVLRGLPSERIETRLDLVPKPGAEAEIVITPACPGPAPAGMPPAWSAVRPQAPAGARQASPGPIAAASSPRQAAPAAPGHAAVAPEDPAARAAAGTSAGGDRHAGAREPVRAGGVDPPARAPAAEAGGRPPTELVVRPGERLSEALKAFLAARGAKLEWRASTDLEAARQTRIELGDWKRTVAFAAASAGYSAILVQETNTVYVRDASDKEAQR